MGPRSITATGERAEEGERAENVDSSAEEGEQKTELQRIPLHVNCLWGTRGLSRVRATPYPTRLPGMGDSGQVTSQHATP